MLNRKNILFLLISIFIFLILLTPNVVFSTTAVLGNNPTLKNLSVNVGELNPAFDSSIIEYSIAVPESVKTVDVNAVPDDTKATVSVSGNKNLKSGLNKITVQVTAENGKDKRTYTINVTKGDVSKANANVENIKITNGTLVPSFDKNVVSYVLQRTDSVEKPTVIAKPEDAKATVSVKDNTDTDSIIYVTCTAPDGITTKTYMLSELTVSQDEMNNEDIQDNNQNIEDINYNDENTEINSNADIKGNTIIPRVLGVGLIILIIVVGVLLIEPARRDKDDR